MPAPDQCGGEQVGVPHSPGVVQDQTVSHGAWIVVGVAYAGGRWSDGGRRMDFVRFSGELVNVNIKKGDYFESTGGSVSTETGDVTQIDLPNPRASGLIEALRIVREIEGIGIVYFDDTDVVRHKLVQQIVKAYDAYTSGPRQ